MTFNFVKTRKAIAVASMSTLLAMGLVSVSAAPANAAACANSAITVGDGTAGSPYQISTPAQLQRLTLQMNTGDPTVGKFYKVMANLDFAGCTFTPSLGGFPFKGNLDGGNFTISNYVVNTSSSYAALFGQAKAAVLKDIVIDGANVKGENYVGALVGLADKEDATPTTLQNITVKNSTVEGEIVVGGIAGGAFNGSGDSLNLLRVDSSEVRGFSTLGGLIGLVSGYPSMKKAGFFGGKVTKLVSAGTQLWFGGLIGRVDNNFALESGGFRGELDLTAASSGNIGFLIGATGDKTVTITDSYARGVAKVLAGTTVAGFIGQSSGTVSLVRGQVRISVQDPSQNQVPARPFTGGAATLTSVFYDSELHNNWTSPPAGAGKTGVEMETYSTFGPLPGYSFGNPTPGTWYWNDSLEGKLFLGWEYEGRTITPCPVGEYSFNGIAPCIDAPAGFFISSTGRIAAEPCPVGTFQPTTGVDSCVNAQAGYFVATIGAIAQEQCAAGTTSDVGATSCFAITSSEPAPYQGPVVSTNAGVASVGQQVVLTGTRLSQVSSVSISGKSAVATCTDTSCSFTVPAGVSAGLQDLVLLGSHGVLTIQGGIRIELVAAAEEIAVNGWTKKISDSEVKVYAKNLVGAGKVQYFLNGKEVAWVRAADQSDPKLRFANGASYLVRTLTLVEGQKNVIEIHVDGERVKRSAHSN